MPAAAFAGAVATVVGGRQPPPQRQPVGEEAARLAVEGRMAAWSRPTGFAEALGKHWARSKLTSLLVGYAAIHAARFGIQPSIGHLVAVAEAIMPNPTPLNTKDWSGVWEGHRQKRFDPATFHVAWLRARVIELERGEAIVARFGRA